MTLEEGFKTYLGTKSAVTTAIGTRVFPIYPPQELMTSRTDNYPCVTYQTISVRTIHSMTGHCNLAYKRFQVISWARTYKAASDNAETLRMVLDGDTGTWGTVEVQSCLKQGETDVDFDLSVGSASQRIFGKSMDYEVCFVEAVPTL